jgi:hypothetical protein
MRTFWETYPVEFSGGLVTNVSPLQQAVNFPGSATALLNFEPSIEGGYKKIQGYEKWSEFPVPGTGQIRASIITAPRSAITVRGGKYYTSVDKADWVERLDLSATAGNKIRWTIFNFNGTEKIVMVDGVNKPVFWTSASQAITLDSAAPSDVQGATRVANFKNHLFFAKGTTLYFTSPFNELDYNAANGAGVIDVGSRITGLVVFREQLIVFSVDRIQRIAGNTSSDFVMQPIAANTGAMCGDTIQEVGGDILYLGPDGVRFLSATERIGDFALERASEKIQKEVTNTFVDCGNYASVVIRAKNQYRLFRYDSDLEPQFQVSFLCTRFIDRQSSGVDWAELRGFKVYCSDSRQIGSSEYIIFASDTNFLYTMEEGTSFDGSAIPCRYRSPFWPITDPRIRKTIYKHTLYLKSEGALNVEARLIFDYNQKDVIQPEQFLLVQDTSGVSFWGDVGTVWGSFTYGGTIDSVYSDQAVGSGFTVAVEYREESINPPFSLDTVILEFRANDRK